jgi:hypothetical protein
MIDAAPAGREPHGSAAPLRHGRVCRSRGGRDARFWRMGIWPQKTVLIVFNTLPLFSRILILPLQTRAIIPSVCLNRKGMHGLGFGD